MKKLKLNKYKIVVSLLMLLTVATSVGLPILGNVSIGTQEVEASSKYHEGITDMKEVNWYTARIYISKTDLQKMGAGMSIGGMWIPKTIVAGFIGTAGYALTKAPGGVWFDYNRLLSGFGGGFGEPHWQ